ncbi:GntR family transcriptional regulator [Pleurocapsa sp. CCALA 161]|uniref:aminotransferase-like domain-containing protein n=1 Tax=Pleurocapsa sp. CCALA 161 TaxID=2107688 RepID=UPI000D07DBE9|nr:PLP-dependent aminotransferase family protein [Pleurocapsa sp. CCALA 161]PSB12212.1 GntR family transcriptional regulator [Pleurocapsa sp. CCALA 161]
MKIPIDRQAPKPIYLQIRDRLSRLIKLGTFKAGDRLPSIRTLAKTIQVNKLTVIEAYSILEADGLIHARPGAGYFINPLSIISQQTKSNFAPIQEVVIPDNSNISFMEIYQLSVQVKSKPGAIDFSSGFPISSGLKNLQRHARRAMKQVTETLFNYDFPQGQETLRQQTAKMLIQLGLEISANDLIITNGSKQGLSLVMNHYLQPGDWIVTESPTYYGTLDIIENIGAKIIGIPMQSSGMNLELLEQYLKSHRPKLIYTVSTLQNPTGITTTLQHRQQLLALAEQYECLILEDNAYEGLNFAPVPPPIKSLDCSDRVIYTGTFSKTLMPGLRVGYLVATGKHYHPLLKQKLFHDLHVSTVSQAIVSEYLASGQYRHHLNHLQASNLSSRNAMLQALENYFPDEATWTIPNGGLFLWVQLPPEISLVSLAHQAWSENVFVYPGMPFFPGQKGYNALRLNFSHPPETIDRGIKVLGKLLKQHSILFG